MFRTRILIPALLAAGLFLTTSAVQADPYHRPHQHGPYGPVAPHNYYGRPAPAFSLSLGIGLPPVNPYYRQPVIVAAPYVPVGTVYYRDCPHDPWIRYGTFPADTATMYEIQLRRQGLDTYSVIR